MSGYSQTTLPRRPRRWLTALLVLVVFAGGLIIGGAGTVIVIARQVRLAIRHPEQIPNHLTDRLTRKLDLTPDQAAQVRRMLTDHLGHIEELRAQIRPQVQSELIGIHSDIRGVLDPKQQEKWDDMFDDVMDNWFPPSFAAATEAQTPSTQP